MSETERGGNSQPQSSAGQQVDEQPQPQSGSPRQVDEQESGEGIADVLVAHCC